MLSRTILIPTIYVKFCQRPIGYRMSRLGGNMCDRDHSQDDLLKMEAEGLITRRQFGVMLGAGMAMMLPAVQNPVKVTESEVTIKTPDGNCDAYFVHPSTGTAP